MWTYSLPAQSQFALMTFTGTIDVDEAYSAATWLREDVGTSPVRVVIDLTDVEFPERCVCVFMGVLEEVAVVDVTLLGASGATREAFGIAWGSFTVPVTFHETTSEWLVSERRRRTAPRKPTPLLALTA